MFTLSDPYLDFTNTEDKKLLNRIVSKQGVGLSVDELSIIFQKYCPAGTYTECLRYVPIVFRSMRTNTDESADLWENILFWILANKKYLVSDKLYEKYLAQVKSFIDQLLLCDWDFSRDIMELFTRAHLLVISLNSGIIQDMKGNFISDLFEKIKNEQSKNIIFTLYFYVCVQEKKGRLKHLKSIFRKVFPHEYLVSIKNVLIERILKNSVLLPAHLEDLIQDSELYLLE